MVTKTYKRSKRNLPVDVKQRETHKGNIGVMGILRTDNLCGCDVLFPRMSLN